MKIGVDARFLLRKQRGMPLYVSQLCFRLPKAMPDDTFVLYINSAFIHNDTPSEYKGRLKDLKMMHNVTVIDLPHSGEMFWEWWVLPRELKHNPVDLLHMPGNRVILRTSLRQIVTFHDTIEWENLKLFGGVSRSNTLGTNLRAILYRVHIGLNYFWGVQHVRHILTISQFSQNNLVGHFPSAGMRCSYVYHGLPPAFSDMNELVPIQERKGVLMLGGDSNQKNCRNALEAWHALPIKAKRAHPLTIIGFTGGQDSEITKTLQRLGIEEEVTILNWVCDSVVLDSFKSSRAFLFVSKTEGFGFPLVQAMASGTPVVISRAEVLVELGGESMPSAPHDQPLQIAEHLLMLIESDSYWSLVQSKGLQRLSLFHWNNVVSHTKALYRRIGKAR